MPCAKFVFVCLYVCIWACLFAPEASLDCLPLPAGTGLSFDSVCVLGVCVCVYVRLAPLVLSLIPVSGKHQPFKTQMAGFFSPSPLALLLTPNLGNSWGGHADDLSPSTRPPDRLRACTHY